MPWGDPRRLASLFHHDTTVHGREASQRLHGVVPNRSRGWLLTVPAMWTQMSLSFLSAKYVHAICLCLVQSAEIFIPPFPDLLMWSIFDAYSVLCRPRIIFRSMKYWRFQHYRTEGWRLERLMWKVIRPEAWCIILLRVGSQKSVTDIVWYLWLAQAFTWPGRYKDQGKWQVPCSLQRTKPILFRPTTLAWP